MCELMRITENRPQVLLQKSFWGDERKFFRAADAFYARRREGPNRYAQNRARISVVALKSDAAAEKPKDQASRDFLGCSIFDFCNKFVPKPEVVLQAGLSSKTGALFRTDHRVHQLREMSHDRAFLGRHIRLSLVEAGGDKDHLS
jgi:hypothetical protein